jgi:hypothetical protein
MGLSYKVEREGAEPSAMAATIPIYLSDDLHVGIEEIWCHQA